MVYNLYCRNCNEMDTSHIRGRRPLSEVNGEAAVTENGNMFLEEWLMQHQVRRSLVIWRSPLRTIYYFIMETLVLLHIHGVRYVMIFYRLQLDRSVVMRCTFNLFINNLNHSSSF